MMRMSKWPKFLGSQISFCRRYPAYPREFQYPPDLLLYTAENLVESQSTCEMFIVKSYKLTEKINKQGIAEMKTVAVNVFKLDIKQRKKQFTHKTLEISLIFVSLSEPFCVTPSSCSSQLLPCVRPNQDLHMGQWRNCSFRSFPTLPYL
ncbi:unnamed protein product [Cochlearia groenlandica]